jgi:hypothetical protein
MSYKPRRPEPSTPVGSTSPAINHGSLRLALTSRFGGGTGAALTLDRAFQARDVPKGALKAWLANTPTLTIQGRVRQVHTFSAKQPGTATGHRRPTRLSLPEGYMQNFRQAA